jgi:hypothetical protein
MTGVLYEKGDLDTDIHAGLGSGDDEDRRAILLQARGHLGLTANSQSWERGLGIHHLIALRRNQP